MSDESFEPASNGFPNLPTNSVFLSDGQAVTTSLKVAEFDECEDKIWEQLAFKGAKETKDTMLHSQAINRCEAWLRKNTNLDGAPFPVNAINLYHEPGTLEDFRKILESYHSAVDADGYRVTYGADTSRNVLRNQRHPDGILSFTTLLERMPDLRILANEGNHVYLTPLSKNFHYIVVDDMSPTSLGKLKAAGLTPSVVWASSPDPEKLETAANFQCILKVRKFVDDDFDRRIGNEIARAVNMIFGDPKFTGAVHPHRCPGLSNVKEKYRRRCKKPEPFFDNRGEIVDFSVWEFPVVTLIEASGVECAILNEYSRWVREDQFASENAPGVARKAYAKKKEIAGSSDQKKIAVYNSFRSHILSCLKNASAIDDSQLDSTIAIRLRGCGHTQAEIADIIAVGGKALRYDKHRWEDYGKRTAAFAFSQSGTFELRKKSQWISQWKEMERVALSGLGD